MEKNEEVENSILNVLTGNGTAYDDKTVSDWAGQSELNRYKLEQLKNIWEENTLERKVLYSEEVKGRIWLSGIGNTGKSETGDPKKLRKLATSVWLRAAVVLLIVGILSVIVLTVSHTDFPDKTLTKAQNIIVKTNPSGQKSKVFLPDGSIVWLNAQSTIQYIEDFSDSLRTVELSGEAFFEIERDTLSPFIVKTQDVDVRVLGTKFNVNAFESNGGDVTVALTEGAVEVTSRKVGDMVEQLNKGGQGVHYRADTNGGRMEIFEFLTNDKLNQLTGWKNGILVFDGDNFEAFKLKISRWYGVEVEVIGKPPDDWSIRATFQEEYLSNMIKSISINKEFDYELNHKKLVFMFH